MNSDYDEIVVGKSNIDFNKMVEEELNRNRENELEEESKPLEEKIKSKNWKTRKNAYSEILERLMQEKNFGDYLAFYSSILEDQHSTALETALEIVSLFLTECDFAQNHAGVIFKNLLEKCMTNSKANIKQTSKDLMALCFEISLDNSTICECLKHNFENKNPKIQLVAITTATFLISAFGSHVVDYRVLMPAMEKVAESSNTALRNESIEFYKELFKWIRNSIKNYMNKLKDAYQKDLEKAFDETSKTSVNKPQPTRFLRSDKNKNINNDFSNNEIANKLNEIKEEENLFKQTEAVEIFDKYNENWANELIGKEKKWNEKKEMLDDFVKRTEGIKIKNNPRGHIVGTFHKLLKDSNINVVNGAINALESLAKGLRKEFTEAKEFFIPLLEKFKEKREKILTDVSSCLDAFITYCLSIEDILDDINTFLSADKPPHTKEKLCIFLEKTVLKTFISVLRKVSNPLADILFKLSDDANGDVRNAALKCLGVLKCRVGEMQISKIINELCDIKKKKVDEAAEGVTVDPMYDKDDKPVNANNKNKKAVINNSTVNNDMMQVEQPIKVFKNKIAFDETAKDVDMLPVNIESSKPPVMLNKSNSTNNLPTIKPKPKPQQVANIDTGDAAEIEDDTNMSNEDVENAVAEKFGKDIISQINESKWESRKNALSQMVSIVQANPTQFNTVIDIILRFLKIKLKDFKENNFNVLRESLSVIQCLCESCNNFTKKHCVIIIKKICEKLGDNKLKTNVTTLFMQFMEYHTPKYILNILLKHMTNVVKGPMVLKEFALFMEKSIEEFGINTHPVKEIVDYAKFLANNPNPQLRSAATTLLCCIYKYIGPNIKKFLTDIKEATLAVIEKEFENVTIVTNTENKRALKGAAAAEAQTCGNLVENLFPRADISKKIPPKIIKEFVEGKWQVKKEALEALEKILAEASGRILPNGLGELIASLKNKLNDGNKNLVRLMVQFITKLVDALGQGCKGFSKVLIPHILNNLSDKLNLLREDVIKCLEKWAEFIGFESVLIHCPTYLATDNFELRNDLLRLIIKNKAAIFKMDCKEMVPSVISCLLDKSPIIRQLAEELVKEIVKAVNISYFYTIMNNQGYKPALVQTVKLIIDKYSSTIIDTDLMQVDSEMSKPVQQEKPKENKQQTKSVPPAVKKRENNNSTSNDSKKKNGFKPQPMANIKKVAVNMNETLNNIPVLEPQPNKSLLIANNIKINHKTKRLESEKTLAFPNEFITPLYTSNLKTTMANYFNKIMLENAFHSDITKVDTFFSSLKNSMLNESILILEVMDLILKYVVFRNLEFNNNHFYNNMIYEFMKSLSELLIENECSLSEIENKFILEIIVIKIFSINPQLNSKYMQMICEFSTVIKFDIYIDYFVLKFNTIYDEEIRIQLMDILKNVYLQGNAKQLHDANKVRNLFNLMNNYVKDKPTIERNCKMIILSLINELCGSGDSVLLGIVGEYKEYLSVLPNYQNNVKVEAVVIEKEIPISKHNNLAHFSKSPILKTEIAKENGSKESFKPDDVIDQNRIGAILERLYGPDLNKKVSALLDINDLVTNKLKDSQELLQVNINNILAGLKELLKHIFLQPSLDETLLELIKYLLMPLYRIALTKELVENTDTILVYELYQEILKAILFENLENVGTQEEGKKTIKSLNAIIMKLLENINYTDSIIVLIKLLENYRSEPTKVCSLVIKCLLKMINSLPNIINNLDLNKVISSLYDYLIEFEKVREDILPSTPNEDNSLRVLRTLLTEIVKAKNEGIWDIYKSVVEDKSLPDKHLKKWIQVIIRSKNGTSLPNNPGNSAYNSIFKQPDSSQKEIPVTASFSEKSEDNTVIKELNFYIQRLQISSANERKALYQDIILFIQKNKYPIDFLKNKIPDVDYSQIFNLNDLEQKVIIFNFRKM
jgi:hypothetical protein